MAEAWIEKFTRNQTRALLATALHEGLGYATEAFLSVAGAAHRSAVVQGVGGSNPFGRTFYQRHRISGLTANGEGPHI